MRIAICEDTPKDAARLEKALLRYLELGGLSADLDRFESGESLLEAFEPGKYQIIFQDIYMDKNGVTGMQAAEMIRKRDGEVSIIFTTTSEKHGPQSYAVDAAYYIVKPVDEERLWRALEKCRAQIDRYAKTIEIMVNRQPQKIRLRDIYYVEVILHNTLLRTVAGEMKTILTFAELMEKLSGFPFVQCHRSFVVNLVNVSDMLDKDFIMKNGEKVPISKTYQDEVAKAFRGYVRARMYGESV